MFTASKIVAAVVTVQFAAVVHGRGLRGLVTKTAVELVSDYSMSNALANGSPMVGVISGHHFVRPAVNFGYPRLAPQLLTEAALKNPSMARNITLGKDIQPVPHPDTLSFTLKIGMFIPSTNTIMEHEVWSLLQRSDDPEIKGVGIHTVNMVIPSADIDTASANAQFGANTVKGYVRAFPTMMAAEPEYLMMGMAWDQYEGLGHCPIDCPVKGIQLPERKGMGMSDWGYAIKGALETMFPLCDANNDESSTPYAAACSRGKGRGGDLRIGVVIPSDYSVGAKNTVKFFSDRTFFPQMTVAAVAPFGAVTVKDIAHMKASGTMKLIRELVDTHDLDVVVQTGTNAATADIAEALEPEVGVPILSVNAVLLWHALRENGITGKIPRAGRLFRDF